MPNLFDIHEFVRNHERLMHGERLRREMKEAHERGETPTGYRADWILAVGDDLLGRLSVHANVFNVEHPDDMISISDMLDVLATAKKRLERFGEAYTAELRKTMADAPKV